MLRGRIMRRVVVLCLGMAAAEIGAEPAPDRPICGLGGEAQTLLIYEASHAAYSLSHPLEIVSCHLRRVKSQLKVVPATEVTEGMVAKAGYVVMFCPQTNPVLPERVVAALAGAKRPVLWVGHGAERLLKYEPFRGKARIASYSREAPGRRVLYKGREWQATVEPWIPVQVEPEARGGVVMALRPDHGATGDLPLCWKMGNVTVYSSMPTYGTWGYLFSDMLLDFFEARGVQESRVYVRIEDYHCRRNHRDFRRIVDYLDSRHHPFLVAVIPAYRDTGTGEWIEMDTQPEFVEALRYAQQRGGRLVAHGYTHAYKNETGEGHEFWDVVHDRPIPEDSPEYARNRIRRGIRQMLAQGLIPLAWETPHYAGSRNTYTEVANHFSDTVERVQLSDATYLEGVDVPAFTLDQYGRRIIPENLGFVLAVGNASVGRIQAVGDVITRLRGTVAGCFFHPYLSFERFKQVMDTLEGFQKPFLDPADMDLWVQLPEMVMLSGNAERTVLLRNCTVRWKALDRAGRILAEEVEKEPSHGERTFKRRGRGDYEIFEFQEKEVSS